MRERVLFVSRERFRLPLTAAQERKWDAVARVVEPRVVAAATAGSPTRDDVFRLAGPAVPRILDGALYYLRLPYRIARELRAFRPAAALVQGVHETVAFLVARRLAGTQTRVILDVQGDWHEATRQYGSRFRRLLNPLNDALAPVAVRHADAIRVVSEETTALVRALGREPDARFPSYVDAATFAERAPEPLPDGPRAVFVGVLEAVKAFDTLAEAWPDVARRVPHATLHVAGTGSLAATARALAQDARVQWDERLAPDDVARAMDAAWLVCLPSRSEGLPRVAVEAACRGRAVVGGRRGGIPDVVRDGVSGILVDPDDADALADALVAVLADRELAERYGRAARVLADELDVSADAYAANLATLVSRAVAR